MASLIASATYHAKLAHLPQTAKQNTLNPVKKACSVALWVSKLSYMDDFWEDEI